MSTTPEQMEAARIEKFKSLNPVAVCKVIVEDNSNHGITEHELVDLIGNHDRRDGESLAQCFSRHFQAQDENGLALRKAVEIVKNMPFVVDLTPLQVGGEDVNPNDPSKAIAQLQELGRQKWPTATEAQQFANAFSDPVNAELAAKAHQRPRPTTSYPFPR